MCTVQKIRKLYEQFGTNPILVEREMYASTNGRKVPAYCGTLNIRDGGNCWIVSHEKPGILVEYAVRIRKIDGSREISIASKSLTGAWFQANHSTEIDPLLVNFVDAINTVYLSYCEKTLSGEDYDT